jgi:hypothetical protein
VKAFDALIATIRIPPYFTNPDYFTDAAHGMQKIFALGATNTG